MNVIKKELEIKTNKNHRAMDNIYYKSSSVTPINISNNHKKYNILFYVLFNLLIIAVCSILLTIGVQYIMYGIVKLILLFA